MCIRDSYDPNSHEGDYNLLGENTTGSWPLGPHSIIAGDPGFKGIPPINESQIFGSVTSQDFELKAGSPAIDQGTTGDYVPSIDFYSNQRDSLPDIGAIEYNATPGPGRVWFTATNREGEAPLEVIFNNTSPSTFTEWEWDFGDGQTSQEKSPTHTYTTRGRYTVTLIGKGSAGNDTLSVRYYVVVTGGTAIKEKNPVSHFSPHDIELSPNPVKNNLFIHIVAQRTDWVKIAIYRRTGEQIKLLWDGPTPSGIYWEPRTAKGNQLPPGVYFCKVTVNGKSFIKKLIKVE